jgi:hypothetical protein
MKMELHTQGFKGNTTFYGTFRFERKMANKMIASQIKKKKGKKRKEILIFFYVYLFSQILKVNVDLTFSSNTGLLFTLKII